MKIYEQEYTDNLINRLEKLTPDTKPSWGKMSADQMLAHLNVAYDMTFTDKYTRPNAVAKFFITLLAKKQVVGPKPYPKNGRTAPQFIISDSRNFEEEKRKLIQYIEQVRDLGREHFEGKDSHSFGKLTAEEWNVMFGKHTEHHFAQFGI